MLETATILHDFSLSTDKVVQAFSDFPRTHFNLKLQPTSWSAGDVAEHLVKVEFPILKMFPGETKPTAHRPPDQKIALLAQGLGNLEEKFEAPIHFLPGPEKKDQEKIVETLKNIRGKLSLLIPEFDLTETCFQFRHPYVGYLTRLEWIYMIILHSNRHLEQLSRLRRELEKAKGKPPPVKDGQVAYHLKSFPGPSVSISPLFSGSETQSVFPRQIALETCLKRNNRT